MATITLQRVGELLRTVFELLWNKPDGLPAKEILTLIPEIIDLTDHEKGYSPSYHGPQYERIVRLATIPLVKAGWLVKNNKGYWYITEEGRQACKIYPNAQELYKQALRVFEERKSATPEIVMALETAEEIAWEHIWKHLQETKPDEFQQLAADIIQAMGYHIRWVAPPEKSRGHINIVAYVDPIGAKGGRILVQLIHKSQAVTVEGLRAFLSILGPSDFGLLISSGGFTHDAKEALMTSNFQRLTAFDLATFLDLWVEYYDKLSQEARARLPLKKVYFLAPLSQ